MGLHLCQSNRMACLEDQRSAATACRQGGSMIVGNKGGELPRKKRLQQSLRQIHRLQLHSPQRLSRSPSCRSQPPVGGTVPWTDRYKGLLHMGLHLCQSNRMACLEDQRPAATACRRGGSMIVGNEGDDSQECDDSHDPHVRSARCGLTLASDSPDVSNCLPSLPLRHFLACSRCQMCGCDRNGTYSAVTLRFSCGGRLRRECRSVRRRRRGGCFQPFCS
jgi:hypothetical protein